MKAAKFPVSELGWWCGMAHGVLEVRNCVGQWEKSPRLVRDQDVVETGGDLLVVLKLRLGLASTRPGSAMQQQCCKANAGLGAAAENKLQRGTEELSIPSAELGEQGTLWGRGCVL